MSPKVQLLCTVVLDEVPHDIEVQVDNIPFINVSVVADKNIHEEVALLARQQAVVIFTSANAVRAVAGSIDHQQLLWDIYCIGNATKNAVLEIFSHGQIKGEAHDATALAIVIKQAQVKEAIFFCGDQRMDALPLSLAEAGIAVREIIVYTTAATPVKTGKEYDGILFFSPSGVDSFFSVNAVPAHTILFAIGHTTAAAVKRFSGNVVVTGDSPSKEGLVKKAINYFHTKAIA